MTRLVSSMEHLQPRLKWSALVFVLMLASAGVACSSAAQPPAEKAPAAAEEQPQYGGTARLFGLSSPVHMDMIATADSGQSRATGGIYERLVDFDYSDHNWDVNRVVVPALAERWEMTPDGKNYTFFLRKGVKYHDGEEFTAADVLFTYNRVIKEKTPLLNNLRDVDQIEAPDPYTVKITTRVADVTFLGGLTTVNLGIQPKHAADKGVDFRKVAIGTGPFKLGSNDVTTKTEWLKNENYWQKGLPYLDRVEVIWPLDKSGMIAAFASGVLDTTGLSNQADFDTLRKVVPSLQFIKGPFGSATDLYINIEHPAFKDIRVRRAMHLAVDRQELAKLISGGDLWLNCVFPSVLEVCPPGMEQTPGFRQPKDADIAEGKRLMAEAGYPNGFEFKMTYSLQFTQSVPLVEPFVGFMARIGIKVIPDGRDTATYREIQRQGNYDAFLINMLGTEPAVNLYGYLHSKGTFNKHGTGSPALDRLIEQQTQAFDPKERKKLLAETARLLMDGLWTTTMVDATQYLMAQAWLKGPMVLNTVSNGSFAPAQVMGTSWIDQKLAPKR